MGQKLRVGETCFSGAVVSIPLMGMFPVPYRSHPVGEESCDEK